MSANSKIPRRFSINRQPGQPASDRGTSASPTSRQERLHKSLTRSITPALVLFVGFIILLTIIVLNVRMTRALQDVRQQSAGLVQSVLKLELDDLFNNLRNTTQLSGVRNFAVNAVTLPLGSENRTLRTSQSEMLRAFEDLLNSYEGQLTSVRFLLPSGAIWGSAEVRNSLIDLDPELISVNPAAPQEEEVFQQALLAGSGTVLASQAVNSPNELTLYTPVTTVDGANAGVLALTLDLSAIFRRMETTLRQSNYTDDGLRSYMVADRYNRILWYSGDELPDEDIIDAFNRVSRGFENWLVGLNLVSSYVVSDFGQANFPWRLGISEHLVFSPNFRLLATVVVIVGGTIMGFMLLRILENLLQQALRPVEQAAQEVSNVASLIEVDERALQRDLRRRTLVSRSIIEEAQAESEIGNVSESVERITEHLQVLRQRMELEGQRRHRDIEIAARISRATATLYDLDKLFDRAIEMICSELNFYHAQIFLLDDIGRNAVLVRSRGEVGRQMLDEQFKMPINGDSVIGRTTQTKEPVLIQDTLNLAGEPFVYNPLLDDTRSELGLPLMLNNEVIGVLDIQSRFPYAFKREDLPFFQLIADQLSIAINTARLLNTSRAQMNQVEDLARRSTRDAWSSMGNSLFQERAYRYDLTSVQPVTEDEAAQTGAADERTLTVPIALRGEQIGVLSASMETGQSLSEGDGVIMRAVADRVALAIENARLFQETQISLSETSILYQLSRYLNEADSLNDVLQAIIISVTSDATGAQVWVYDDAEQSGDQQSDWLTLIEKMSFGVEGMVTEHDSDRYNVPEDEDEAAALTEVGARIFAPFHPLFADLQQGQVTLVNDVEQDSRVDPVLLSMFHQIDTRAMAIIPLSVRAERLGLLMIQYPQARDFNEQEGRVFAALVDQAGVSIDNRLLLKQTEEARRRSETLYIAGRRINTMQTFADLIYAVMETRKTIPLDFRLTLLEGALDETGWPTVGRIVAQSRGQRVDETVRRHPLVIALDSPMRERKAVILRDDFVPTDTVPVQVITLRREGYRMMAHFPMFSANQPIAILTVMSVSTEELSSEDLDVYYALAVQMATQLENRRLLIRTELALDETHRLYLASRAISGAQDLQTVYENALEHLARPFAEDESSYIAEITDAAEEDGIITTGEHIALKVNTPKQVIISLLLAQPEPGWNAQALECVFTWANSATADFRLLGEADTIPTSEFPVGRMLLAAGQSINLPSLREKLDDPDGEAVRSILERAGTTSATITPLQYRQEWYGVVLCQSDSVDTFDEQYVRFVEAVADQIAIAIENRQLFHNAQIEAQRAQNEAQRALALANAAQLANQVGLDFEVNLSEVMASVAQSAGYDRWAIHLLDPQKQTLDALIVHLPNLSVDPSGVTGNITGKSNGKTADKQDPLHFTLESEHPISLAVRTGQTLLVNDLGAHPAFSAQTKAQKRQLDALRTEYGKFVVSPIRSPGGIVGTLTLGMNVDAPDLDEGDEEVATTLATQIAVAQENRRLFLQVQNEQQTLRSVMSTLPAGIVVLDPKTLRPVLSNEQAEVYLGEALREKRAFNAENYDLYRTGTSNFYPDEELPIITAREGFSTFSDDVALISSDSQLDLLVNAAPIVDGDGNVAAIVTSFSDISNLRGLENTLQESLRETIAIYEAQRELSDALVIEDVLDVLINQLINLQATEACVLLVDEDTGALIPARTLVETVEDTSIFVPLLNNDSAISHSPEEVSEHIGQQVIGHPILENAYVITVPLRASARNMPIGWLIAIRHEVPFVFENERLIMQLGGIASTVIDNRYLIQRTAQALQEAKTLYEANSVISSARDIDQLSDALHTALAHSAVHEYTAALSHTSLDVDVIVHTEDESTQLLRTALLRENIPDNGIFVADTAKLSAADSFEGALLAASGSLIRAFGAVPLRVKGERAGIILTSYHEPHPFSEGEKRYLSAISASASVVLDNIALVSEIRTALEETSTLYQANRQLIEASSPQEIVQAVVDYLIEDHVDQVFMALLNNSTWESPSASIVIASNWNRTEGIDMEGLVLSPTQFPLWRIISTPEFTHVADINAVDTLDETDLGGLEMLEMRSYAVLPLRVSNRAIGAIWMGSREAKPISPRAERVYRTFAEQASLSLEAAYLLRQTERRAAQLQTSAEISSSAGRILNLEVLLPQVVELIRNSFEYDQVQVFLLDDMREYALLRASTGEAGQELLRRNHKIKLGSTSVVGRTVSDGMPIIAQDTAAANVVHLPNPLLPLTRSEMALPLIIKDRVIGALDVQSNQANYFTEEDIAALTTLAAQISIAIENARLYADAQKQANRMGFLFEATRSAAAAETLEATLQNVANYLHGNQNVLATVLYLRRDYVDAEDQLFSTLEAVALEGIDQPLTEIEAPRLDDTESLLIQVAANREAYIIASTAQEPSYIPVVSAAQSAIVVPLVGSGELLGMIVQEAIEPNRFNFEDLQLMSTLSSSISAVIQSTQLLERLQNANEELRELDRIKSEFLANMSHELRTPLNSIIGFSRVMLKGIDGPLTEMQEQDLNTIYTSGQHLLTLINDVLDQAKIAAGKMDLKADYFDMKSVIESVKSIGLGLVKEKNLQLVVEMAQTMPKAFGDEFRTRQVLINLVSNASKFTSQGGITIRSYPVEDKGQTWIRVDVIDTGMGIAKKNIPLLFEAFRQVDSSLTRTAGGTGLGLPIARSLVEMQGGEMLVESEVNVGSTFSITLPTTPPAVDDGGDNPNGAVDSANGTSKPAGDARSAQRTTGALRSQPASSDARPPEPMLAPSRPGGPSKRMMEAKRQVLLIEDSPDMVDQMRRALQPDGFEVLAASITLEAEAMASGLHPTLIVMDVNFQKGAGWDILERLKGRDDTADIPIIIVTLSNEEERARQMGVHSFIQRPFLPETLLNAAIDAEAESNLARILIIDDEPDAVRLLEQLLSENGQYRVFHATNGADGVAMVARRRPNLILLDLRMPEMDGFKVLEELRAYPEAAAIPVIVVTGDADLSKSEKEMIGNVFVLPKTVINEKDFRDFIDHVQKHLSGEEGGN